MWPTQFYNFSAQEIPCSVGGKIGYNFESCQKHQAAISPCTSTFFRFFPCSKRAEHGKQNARTCIVPATYENRVCSVSMSSRSGKDYKDGKIIGILIQSRDKIIVSKISRPVLGPIILYKVAQWPGRKTVHSLPHSPTVSSWTGAQKTRAHLYLSYIGYKKPIPFSIFHNITAREGVLSFWQWSSLTFPNLSLTLKTETETKKFLCNDAVNYWCRIASVVGKWITSTKQWRNNSEKGKLKDWERNLSKCHSVHHKLLVRTTDCESCQAEIKDRNLENKTKLNWKYMNEK